MNCIIQNNKFYTKEFLQNVNFILEKKAYDQLFFCSNKVQSPRYILFKVVKFRWTGNAIGGKAGGKFHELHVPMKYTLELNCPSEAVYQVYIIR